MLRSKEMKDSSFGDIWFGQLLSSFHSLFTESQKGQKSVRKGLPRGTDGFSEEGKRSMVRVNTQNRVS
ncbi:hypothetical protein LINPERHAP1_LOCUS761, partial [Linum perenne]